MITPEMLAKSGSEQGHQKALFCWAAMPEQQTNYPELALMFHIPNGGTRNKIEAANLKAMGVKRGVPDIFLPVARGRYHGLFIEMKSMNGTMSDEQIIWEERLQNQEYYVARAYMWESARDWLIWYLKGCNRPKGLLMI